MLLKEKGKPFVFEDVPKPTPNEGEAVAKIIATGAGLTIHHTRMGRTPDIKYPLIIGHEITAEISSVGRGVKNLKEGDAGEVALLEVETSTGNHKPYGFKNRLSSSNTIPG